MTLNIFNSFQSFDFHSKQHLNIRISHWSVFETSVGPSPTFPHVHYVFAAEKGDGWLQGEVDGRLHHQLLWPNLVQKLILLPSMSSRVLQRHQNFLSVAERHSECPLPRHKGSTSPHRVDCLVSLLTGHQFLHLSYWAVGGVTAWAARNQQPWCNSYSLQIQA